jgi:hypothetical protein
LNTRALTVAGINAVQITVDQTAYAARDAALTDSKGIAAVESDLAQEMAVATLRDIKGLLKTVEDSRKDVKSPVLALGKAIDAEATKFTQPLEIEAARLSKLVATYQDAQRRAAEEAERKRQAELARIERERRQAEEAARREAEEAQAKARTMQEAVEAEERAKRQAEAAEQRAKLEREKAQMAMEAPVAKPKSMFVKPTVCFEVTDILELFEARPDLCELTPRAAAINAALRNGDRQIPGLRIWEETRVGVRV